MQLPRINQLSNHLFCPFDHRFPAPKPSQNQLMRCMFDIPACFGLWSGTDNPTAYRIEPRCEATTLGCAPTPPCLASGDCAVTQGITLPSTTAASAHVEEIRHNVANASSARDVYICPTGQRIDFTAQAPHSRIYMMIVGSGTLAEMVL